MTLKYIWSVCLRSIIGALLFFIGVTPAFAQFSGDFGAVNSSIHWGTDTSIIRGTPIHRLLNNATQQYVGGVNQGFVIPPGQYTLYSSINSNFGQEVPTGQQPVTVIDDQTTTVAFDASLTAALVKGTAHVNGQPVNGVVRACAPTGDCHPNYSSTLGALYNFDGGEFSIVVAPGSYRIGVWTAGQLMGIVPITVTAGQLVTEGLQFEINLGALSANIRWGNLPSPGTAFRAVLLENTTTGQTISASGGPSDGYDLSTDFIIPAGEYRATGYYNSANGYRLYFDEQILTISANQRTTANFDSSSASGLVQGSVSFLGQTNVSGYIKFCAPTGDCSAGYSGTQGPMYNFEGGQFAAAVAPGNYRIRVWSGSVDIGIIPITVVAGQILDDPALDFVYAYGAVSASTHWSGDTTLPLGQYNYSLYNPSTGQSFGVTNDAFIVPPAHYEIFARLTPPQGAAPIELGSQQINVVGQQTTTVVFDASETTGKIRGTVVINGTPADGAVRLCQPIGDCPFNYSGTAGARYDFQNGSFTLLATPGSYRLSVWNTNGILLGTIPLTIDEGQLIDLSTNAVSVPSGLNVTVSVGNITLTFDQVDTSGFVLFTTTTTPQGGPPPSSYKFLNTYYELTTSAGYSGQITLSFTYDQNDVTGNENKLKLLHWDGSGWQDITTSLDTVNNVITGVTSTLSPFVIAEFLNSPPTVQAGGPYSVNEGGSVSVTATGTDLENGTLTYAWDLDDNGTFETPGQTATFLAANLDGPGTKTIAAQVTDIGGLTATSQATVTVVNVAPAVGTIVAPIDPIQLNSTITLNADFSDPGTQDTHTGTWEWGDGTSSNAAIQEANGSGNASGTHTYTTPGVYTIKLTITDKDGSSAESVFEYVVVYNQDGGYVTGGGWIDSPAGAYTTNLSLTGKANFGFVSKYEQGANIPSGQTEFQFKVASFNFHSTSYDWLVIAGAHAKFKGSGAINGTGDYAFLLTASDGQINGGGGVDSFRIKIWDKSTGQVVYDNQSGASDDANATMNLGGGSIVIHN